MRLLCLSNGHGEDIIALRILNALRPHNPEIAVLPIVGTGHAYQKAGFPVVGPLKAMPSGGFIYMDGKQLARDLRGGLAQLTLAQLKAVRAWVQGENGAPMPILLAVGDIVPLIFAWLSGAPYVFVGTAKSEYYIRDEAGWLPRPSWWSDRLQRATGCIYLPWERWLLSRPQCQAVFPRDTLTAQYLQRFGIPALDLGNPMMDGLAWPGAGAIGPRENEPEENEPGENEPIDHGLRDRRKISNGSPIPLESESLTLLLMPGSRPPEAYENWDMILQAINGLLVKMERPLVCLAAIAPGLDLEHLCQQVRGYRWQQLDDSTFAVGLADQRATLILSTERFAEFLQRADMAIALAGTATEQFVGLGKPAIAIVGQGPQFTAAFAEAQTRLLGPSVTLVQQPSQVATALQSLLNDPDRLQTIAANGRRRMGEPGAAARIAEWLYGRASRRTGATTQPQN
jgi:hypothetical protein